MLEGNAALNGEKTRRSCAEEFKITPREVLAVVEHFKMSDGVRASTPTASPSTRATAAAVVDDDDDEGPTFTIATGISDEVRAQVC